MPGYSQYDRMNLSGKKVLLNDEDSNHLESVKSNELVKSDKIEQDDISARSKIAHRVKKYREDEPKKEKMGKSISISLPLLYRAYLEKHSAKFGGNMSESIRTYLKVYYIIESLIKEYTEETFNIKNIKPVKSNQTEEGNVYISSFTLGKKNHTKMAKYMAKGCVHSKNDIVNYAMRDYFVLQILTDPKYSKKLRERLEALK